MATFPTPEEMRAEFADLCERRAAILAESGPKREARDKILSEANAKAQVLEAEVREIETELAEIAQQQAMIARALGGRTGE